MLRPSPSRTPEHRLPAHAARLLLPALAAVLALLAPATLAASAQASGGGDAEQSAYRFWGYYQLTDGAWTFAETGPGETNPGEGDVEGWRFAAASPSDPRLPRATPTFEDVCAGTPAVDGEERVAVVIDYGRPADSANGAEPPQPRAECATVPPAATGADVLAAVAQVRGDPSGLVCGIDSYPADGCGDTVPELSPEAAAPDQPVELAGLDGAAPSPTADADATEGTAAGADATEGTAAGTSTQDDGPGTAAWWVTIPVVAVIAVLAVLAMRRRRTLHED